MVLLTRAIAHSLRVNPLHIYRSLFALSAYDHCGVLVDRLLDIFLKQFNSDQHICLWYPANCYWLQPICRGCCAPIYTTTPPPARGSDGKGKILAGWLVPYLSRQRRGEETCTCRTFEREEASWKLHPAWFFFFFNYVLRERPRGTLNHHSFTQFKQREIVLKHVKETMRLTEDTEYINISSVPRLMKNKPRCSLHIETHRTTSKPHCLIRWDNGIQIFVPPKSVSDVQILC